MNLTKMAILIGIIALSVGGIYVVSHHQKQSTPVFQPEASMLSQALEVSQQSTTTNTQIIPDHPVNATTTKYAYDSGLCKNTSAPYICFAGVYKGLVSNFGASIAIADLKERSSRDSAVSAECHPLMHVIGRQASQSYSTVSEAFQHGDVFCWSGYYHGIMEGMVAKISLKNLPSQLNSICADIPGKETYNFDYYNCVHGLGHGIMAQLGDEVFDSLKMCDSLTGDWEQQSCYSGVYMQNIIDSTNVADTDNVVKYLKPDEPLYPCTAVEDKYKGQCYLGQTSYALQVTGYNFKKVADLCTTVAEPYRDICFQSLGRDAANQARHDATITKTTCALSTDTNDETNCIIGAAKEIISYYHSDTQAKNYCSLYSGELNNTCMQTTIQYYKNF